MARRRFDPVVVPVGDGTPVMRRVHRFRCTCGTVHDVSANTYGGSRNTEDLNRVMQRLGWEIGNKPENDRCPDCVTKARRARLKVVETEKENSTMASPEPAPATPAANAPREMTIDDALIIYDKLQETYDTKAKGYTDDWTDAKVANDLSVPRAWVVDVRRKRFGDSGANDQIGAVLQEARATVSDIRDEIKTINSRLKENHDQLVAMQKVRDGLQSRADRIDRKIAEIEQAVR